MISSELLGEGPDLVLLHGVGLDRRMWSRCAPRLAESHRVRLVDLRGHGRSPAAGPGTTLADLAGDVSELLEGPTHVVGFSLGALVGQQLALSVPDRVSSLTLVSSVATRTPEERKAVLGRLEVATADLAETSRRAVDRWFSPEWRAAEPELVEEVLATLLANNPASYLRCYEIFATADADLGPRLRDITAPTLAITGELDPGSTPQMSHRLAAAIPGARAVVVPGTRHLLPLERPTELTDAVLAHTRGVDRDVRTAAQA